MRVFKTGNPDCSRPRTIYVQVCHHRGHCESVGDRNGESLPPCPMPARDPMPVRGVLLQDLTWVEAQAHLDADTVVVIPLGAAAKQHGPHLRLDNDWTLAQYFAARVLAATAVVVLPT